MANPTGYSRSQIALHWLVVLLIAVQYVFADGMEHAWRAVQRGQEVTNAFAANFHVVAGVLVLLFVLWRIALRLMRGAPAQPAGQSPLQEVLAVWTHRLLYLLLLLVPISGLAAWYGDVQIAGGVHGLFFNLLFALAGLHVLAAIYHQWVVKDGLIRRMMRAER